MIFSRLTEAEVQSDTIATTRAINRAAGREVVPVPEPAADNIDAAAKAFASAFADEQERRAQGPAADPPAAA